MGLMNRDGGKATEMKWNKSDKYTCHGQVKYSGITTGSVGWRSGSLVMNHNGNDWKMEVYYDCSENNRFSSLVSQKSITKLICKSQLVLTLQEVSTKDEVSIYFKPLNSSCVGQMKIVQNLLEDINQGHFVSNSQVNGSEVGTGLQISQSPNVKPHRDGESEKVFTSMKDFTSRPVIQSNGLVDEDDSKENQNGGLSLYDQSKKFLHNGIEKARNCLQVMQTSGFYKTDTSRSYGTFANYSSNKRVLGLMPDPTRAKKPRLSSDVDYSWNKALTVQPPEQKTQQTENQPPNKGFSNLGNTCYMNAILQSLFGLDTFSADLLRASYRMTKATSQQSLYHALSKLLRSRYKTIPDTCRREMLRGVKSAISTTVKRFSGYQQHDAHEFLGQVLDQLKEEVMKVMKSTPSPRRDSPHSDPTDTQEQVNPTVHNFELEVLHTITCINCQETVTKPETFNDLSVDIPRSRQTGAFTTIQRALDLFFRAEQIEYVCEKCGGNKAEVNHKFTKLPRVLVLHLKRYNYDQHAACQSKMAQSIKVNKFLTLQSHCDEDTRPPYPAVLNLPVDIKSPEEVTHNENTPSRRRLDMGDSKVKIRFRKTKVLPSLDEVDGDLPPSVTTSTPHKKHKAFDLENTENHIKSDLSLVVEETQEDKDLARALELSLKEVHTPKQNVSVASGEEEDKELARVLELSLKEANQRNQEAMNKTDLTEGDDDSDLARALELSLKEANIVAQMEEEDYFLRLSTEEEDQELVREADISLKCLKENEEESRNKGTSEELELTNKTSQKFVKKEEKVVQYKDQYKQIQHVTEELLKNDFNEKGELPFSYRLVSVVNHVGSSSVAGHYISDVYDIKKASWFSCNDSNITKMLEDDMLLRRQRTGYIFFYLSKEIFEDLKDNYIINQKKKT